MVARHAGGSYFRKLTGVPQKDNILLSSDKIPATKNRSSCNSKLFFELGIFLFLENDV